jgi:Fe2+ or Zn2+ uptake regulation protein
MLNPVKCKICGLSCEVEPSGDHYEWVCNHCHQYYEMSDEDVDAVKAAAQKSGGSGGTSANKCSPKF